MNTAAVSPVDAILELAPLGVSLRIECSGAAPDAIAAVCCGWEGRTDGQGVALRLRIEVSPALSGMGDVAIEVDSSCLTVRGPGANARAELDRGFAHCAVSAEYLGNPIGLRQVVEPLVLMMLAHRDRTPLHASAFMVDELAILLSGRSGAGKSCLARAADSAGFQVLSDDTVYVQLSPGLTVWGWPTAVHLLAQDAPAGAGPTRVRNGKVKLVVPLRSASQGAIPCRQAVLCFLARSDGEPTLNPISAAAAHERLWPLDEGFDLLPGPIARAAALLSANGAWDLGLSADPTESVRLLAASLPRLRETAAFARR